MREIGTIATEKEAQRLADYLLTREISTKIMKSREGFAIWVHRDEHLEEARKEFARFLESPNDPIYQESARAAGAIRKKAEDAEAEYRRNVRRLTDLWSAPLWERAPLTFALVAISSAVMIGTTFLGFGYRLESWLTFSVLTFTDDGGWVDSGLKEIREGQIWRLVTPIFIHFGFLHFFFNMAWLVNLAPRIEWVKGRLKLLVMVLLIAICSNYGQFLATAGRFGGMSGVVYGLFGYVLVSGRQTGEPRFQLSNQSIFIMFLWFILCVSSALPGAPGEGPISILGSVANTAHGVGLALGIALGLLGL